MSIVLRLSGADLDIDSCLSWIPKERVEAMGRPGERDGGRITRTFGLNVLLADDDDLGASLAGARALLEKLASPLRELADQGAQSEVDVALHVESGGSHSVSFSPDFLAAVLAPRAELRVSAYPVAGD